jgi:hypothetical protein
MDDTLDVGRTDQDNRAFIGNIWFALQNCGLILLLSPRIGQPCLILFLHQDILFQDDSGVYAVER